MCLRNSLVLSAISADLARYSSATETIILLIFRPMQIIFCRPLQLLRIALLSGSSFLTYQVCAQTGPGGVGSTDGSTSLKAWYRVDNGLVVNGVRVSEWANSVNIPALDLTESSNPRRPQRSNNAINGYPEIGFSGTHRLRTGVGSITATNFVTNQASTFVVAKAANTTQTSCVYTTDPIDNNRFSNHIPWNGDVFYDIGDCCVDRIQVVSPPSLNNTYNIWSYNAINTAVGKQLYRNGALVADVPVAASTFNTHTTHRFSIGAYESGVDGFQGDVTEVIVFNQKINTTQRIIIQNYLAAKYGLALASNDYYTLDDAANSNFDHNVAGIGRESATDLHTDSRGTGIVRINNPVGLDDGEYFFWGHNSGAMTTQTTDVPVGIQSRYTRQWRGQERGDITSIDIEFDLTGLTVNAYQLRLLVDTDDDGQFADETPIGGAIALGSNLYKFYNVTQLTASASATHRFTLAIAPSVAPGNVTGNLLWWLKADAGTVNSTLAATADGDGVRLWLDQTSSANDAANTDGSTQPIFRSNVINGYPALEFNGTKYLDATKAMGISATESFVIFMVFKQRSYQTDGGLSDGAGTFIIDRPTATDNLASFKVVNTDKYAYQRRKDDGSDLGGPVSATPVNTEDFVLIEYYRNRGNSTEGIYINGRLDVSIPGVAGDITAPNLRIGRHATNPTGGMDGYFVEIVAYDRIPSNAERQRIESYLALKYGITLDPSVDYLRSGGSTIYPSTGSHSGYVHDIAGIGRDSNSGLYQFASRSQNAGNMIYVTNPSDLEDNEFFIWGHNNVALSSVNDTDVGGGIQRRLNRVWRVKETGGDGNVGSISITVDLSQADDPKNPADLRLLVDSDGIFANATQYSVSSYSGDLFTFNNVNMNTDNYFTIGTVNKVATPLPVELTSFEVTYEPPVVVATWETASETNNDFFTLERAGEDMNFFELLHQPGAGNSTIPRTYTAIDPHPFGGRSYYRLKQTDYNGKTSYSSIRRMDIDETGRELVLYPNPNNGRDFEFSMNDGLFQLQEVEVLNSQGITLERIAIDSPSVNQHSIHLDKPLKPGFYLVRALYNGKWKAFRVVVGAE
jgi:hypothetical protein